MHYIKNLENFKDIFNFTKEDIEKIKSSFNTLRYIVEDEGFTITENFDTNVDNKLPKFMISKQFIYNDDEKDYYFPKSISESDELMEFNDRICSELEKDFKIKIHNTPQWIGWCFLKKI